MIAYIIFYFIIFVLSFKIKKNKIDIFDFLLLAIMITFSAIRYGIGTDYFGYKIVFDNIYKINLTADSSGIGFTILVYFIKIILRMDYQVLIALCSILTNLLIYKFIKKNSTNPGMSILLYISLGFYTLSFNMFRQMLSIAFVLTGFDYFKEKKNIRCLFCYIVGSMFHTSSILAIIIYTLFSYLKNYKINPKYIFICGGIGLLLYNSLYYNILTKLDYFKIYANKEYMPGIGTYINVLVYVLMLIIFVWSIKSKIIQKNKSYNLFLNIFMIGMIVVLLELKNFLFVRIATPYIIYLTLIIPISYEILEFRKKKLESFIFYVCLFIYFLVYINSFGGVIPYATIFGV